MNNQELAQIVKRVQQNKDQYFETLFNEIYQTIHYISFKLLGSATEAEDASQDIILYIYNHIEELKVPEGFNRWMNRIIHGKCSDRQRKSTTQKEQLTHDEYEDSPEPLSDVTPEQMIQSKEKTEIVLDVINQLPMKQKEVVLLYYYQELTAKEISEILSCSIASVKNSLFKAKRSIQIKVESREDLKTYQLYGVGALPLLTSLLKAEMEKVSNQQLKQQLWDGFSMIKTEVSSEISRSYEQRNKTKRFQLCLKAGILSLILFVVFVVSINALQKETDFSESERQNSTFSMTETANSNEIRIQETVGNVKEKLNPQGEPGDSEIVNDRLESELISAVREITDETNMQLISEVLPEKDSERFPIPETIGTNPGLSDRKGTNPAESAEFMPRIWDKNDSVDVIMNQAKLEDKEMESMKYSDEAENGAESVYAEEEYQVKSDTTYHYLELPRIEYVKKGSLPNASSAKPDDVITYSIVVTNIGNVTARGIIIKDSVPQNTTLLPETTASDKPNTEILRKQSDDSDTLIWLIDDLMPGDTVTVSFQVKVLEPAGQKMNKEINIRNVALINVIGDSNDIYQEIENENAFENSNEVIYYFQGSQSNQGLPITGDSSKIVILLLLGSVSVLLMIGLNLSIRRDKH